MLPAFRRGRCAGNIAADSIAAATSACRLRKEPAMPTPSLSSPQQLGRLLNVTEFSPPAGFAEHAQVSDPGIYKQATSDAPAWWAEQARQRLDWQTPFGVVLDDSNPPFYTWFADGTLNASYNC